MIEQYKGLASFYDLYTRDVNYENIADCIENYFNIHSNIRFSELVELGCGTGSLTILLKERNYNIIGIDISTRMLAEAYNKSVDQGVHVMWLNQDMCKFNTGGKVDAVLCCMDGFNHILNDEDMENLIRRAGTCLNDGGLLVFDLLTKSYFENLSGQVFCDSDDDSSCIWSCDYDDQKGLCLYDITNYEKIRGNEYLRHDGIIHEKAWDPLRLKSIGQENGLELLAVYSGWSVNREWTETDDRLVFCFGKTRGDYD